SGQPIFEVEIWNILVPSSCIHYLIAIEIKRYTTSQKNGRTRADNIIHQNIRGARGSIETGASHRNFSLLQCAVLHRRVARPFYRTLRIHTKEPENNQQTGNATALSQKRIHKQNFLRIPNRPTSIKGKASVITQIIYQNFTRRSILIPSSPMTCTK